MLLGGQAMTAGAQASPYHASSPLPGCCRATPVTPPTVDTLPGLLRVVRHAAALDDLPATSRRFVLGSHVLAGALRLPQDARTERAVHLLAEGSRPAGRWRTWGQAAFTRQAELDVAWRNQSAPSLRSAYVWADSVGGTFRSDHLELAAALVSPAVRGFTVALPVDYGLGQGARRNDPRPLYRRRVAEVAPAVRLQRGAHQVGVGVTQGWHREDLEIGGGTSPEVPVVFRLRGIATFDRTQLISAERALIGGVVGGHAAYHWQSTRWAIATGAMVRLERDSVRDGIAAPVSGGSTRRLRQDLRLLARHQDGRGGVELDLRGQQEISRGRDPVFSAVNAIAEGRRVQMITEWWRGTSRPRAAWLIRVEGIWHALERRDIAADAQWAATRFPLAVSGGHRWPIPAGALWVELGASRESVADRRRLSGRPTRLSATIADPEYALMAAPVSGARVGLGWDRVRNGALTSRVAVSASARRTDGPLFDRRQNLAAQAMALTVELF